MMPALRMRMSRREVVALTVSAAVRTDLSEDRSSGRYSMSTGLESALLMDLMASRAFDSVRAAR